MARWRDFDGEYYDWHRFPKSTPLEAKGGIKAQSRRGAFGESWWAKRWVAVLESFEIGARLGRGRSYARRGQVLSITVEKGFIKAAVQGSRPKPYAVAIRVRTIPDKGWKKLAGALSREALFAAKLLAGEMPQEIERVFRSADLSLFPARLKDLATECSCPDWSNPCKHIAAVYYLLGEEFDRDPFLIFKMRGMEREEFLARLGAAGAGRPRAEAREPATGAAAAQAAEPLAATAAEFWAGSPIPEAVFEGVEAAEASAALPRRLGKFPFWRGREPLLKSIEPLYSEAASRGLELFLGGR